MTNDVLQKKIKVVIVDNYRLLREGIVSFLKDANDVEILTSISSGEEAINLPEYLQPDVFLMDIIMQGMDSFEATRRLKLHNPSTKVILISNEVTKDFITAGVKAGIDGYLAKNIDKEQLCTSIRKVIKGERFFSQEVTTLVFEDFYLQKTTGKGLPTKKSNELTRRENEILRMIANGKNLKQIADELFISIKTVETHKLHLQDKLGFSNTAQLVKYAIESDMV
jgi:DNA-binding NarL/FixJ family response regulator